MDGYSAYERLPGVTLIGCWAHARRKFDETLKSLPSSKRSTNQPVAAAVRLDYCNRIFAIERSLKGLSPVRRVEERYAQSLPLLNEFKAWLDHQQTQVLPKNALGQAITYCLRQWKKLTAFLQDGRLDVDNNRSEQAIKPFVIGRKNWLFANTPKGATSSAVIYSIIQTAKENGLKPFHYLTYLFERLPNIDIADPVQIDALLPWPETLPETCQIRSKPTND